MKSNIVLIGFMGTGKSAVGRRLARELKMDYMDIDQEIETLVGMKIKDIFRRFGETRFRSEETLMVKKAAQCENTVISSGGGVVLKEENVAALKETGILVELYADPGIILERVSKNSNRPLVQGASLQDIEERYQARREFYDVADIRIDTGIGRDKGLRKGQPPVGRQHRPVYGGITIDIAIFSHQRFYHAAALYFVIVLPGNPFG